jgi:phage tail-like protein
MRRPAIERLLPAAYQRAAAHPGLLVALLDAMEAMHAPTEETLAAVDDLFTPYRSPDRMVPFLLGWVAFDHVLQRGRDGQLSPTQIPLGRLRELLAVSADLARRRGTAAGLRGVIETVTQVPVRIEEPPERDFHIVVRVPAGAAGLVPLITRLVEAEKPAATTYEVAVDATTSAPDTNSEGDQP